MAVQTASGTLSAAKVILTNNGHLESFGLAVGRLMHIFLYFSMTVELDQDQLRKLGCALRWGITPSDPMGTTMRRIVTRTCATLNPGMTVSQSGMGRAARIHRQKFADRFPALAGMKMEHS